jgi:glycosyltransferase involved in cell wall biosynthesis
MVGDDTFSEETLYFTEVKRSVIESGLDARIIFTGFKKDIESYISCVDVVVSTSFGEPLGQTLLQAMVMGKPVIAIRSGGPLEIVASGETGLLVEPADISSLSEAMKKLYNNRETAIRMGSRGKARFSEHFLTAGEMTEKIDGVLLENTGFRG